MVTWGELSRRSNNLARALIERGAAPGDKIALYMRNRPEYLETLNAAFKARRDALGAALEQNDASVLAEAALKGLGPSLGFLGWRAK